MSILLLACIAVSCCVDVDSKGRGPQWLHQQCNDLIPTVCGSVAHASKLAVKLLTFTVGRATSLAGTLALLPEH